MATVATETRPRVDRPPPPDRPPDGQDVPRRGDVDAAAARAAWARRVRWRLANPGAWRAALAQLDYFDPDYTYDEGHEYAFDWTTDPHLGEDIQHLILDEDGFVSTLRAIHNSLIESLCHVLGALLGNRVEREPQLHFTRADGKAAKMFTEGGRVSTQVKPDVLVLRPELVLPAGVRRSGTGRTIRLDKGAPIPEMAVEVLSPTTERKDMQEKLALYARLGIAEYWICDPGVERDDPSGPATLHVYRLQGDHYEYVRPQPDPTDPEASACYSAVCGTHVRLRHPDTDRDPRIQLLDPNRNRWRDRQADAEFDLRERHSEGLTEGYVDGHRIGYVDGHHTGFAAGRTETAIAMLHQILDDVLTPAQRDAIAANWRRFGLPDDVGAHMWTVRDTPDTWENLLKPDPDVRVERDDQPPPRDW